MQTISKSKNRQCAPREVRYSHNVWVFRLVNALFIPIDRVNFSKLRKMIGNTKSIVLPIHNIRRSSSGINCCCFACCTCINLQFLKTEPGLLKIAEAILGSFCQSLAINFGLSYAGVLGSAYHGFLTTASWCLVTTLLLLFCYIVSEKTFNLVRQSIFETVFNSVAAFSYLSSCSYLAFAVKTFLYPLYLVTPFFQVYPAMTGAYVVGIFVGLVHGYDAYKSYRYYKGYR